VKHRLILIAILALAVPTLAYASTRSNHSPRSSQTLDLTGLVTGYHVALDASPKGPSAGDIGYGNGTILEHGKRVGRYQGICTSLPQNSQQCTFTLGLPGGQLIVESGYGPGFNTGSVALEAIVGGTGTYLGARGEGRDKELSNTKLAFHLQLLN
jgi:hypothetical protein